jgi:hypothetical protein
MDADLALQQREEIGSECVVGFEAFETLCRILSTSTSHQFRFDVEEGEPGVGVDASFGNVREMEAEAVIASLGIGWPFTAQTDQNSFRLGDLKECISTWSDTRACCAAMVTNQ